MLVLRLPYSFTQIVPNIAYKPVNMDPQKYKKWVENSFKALLLNFYALRNRGTFVTSRCTKYLKRHFCISRNLFCRWCFDSLVTKNAEQRDYYLSKISYLTRKWRQIFVVASENVVIRVSNFLKYIIYEYSQIYLFYIVSFLLNVSVWIPCVGFFVGMVFRRYQLMKSLVGTVIIYYYFPSEAFLDSINYVYRRSG